MVEWLVYIPYLTTNVHLGLQINMNFYTHFPYKYKFDIPILQSLGVEFVIYLRETTPLLSSWILAQWSIL